MKSTILLAVAMMAAMPTLATEKTITSPDGKLVVTVSDQGGKAVYQMTYAGKTMLRESRLGLKTNIGDFTQNLTMTVKGDKEETNRYTMTRTKASSVERQVRRVELSFVNKDQLEMDVEFYVSNNDVAYRYLLARPKKNNPKCAVVYGEASSYNFPDQTTTFLSPQIQPMTGWERTKPSYEEVFSSDAPMTQKSQYGVGYTYPCLFRVGEDGWVLVSETGVSGEYVGTRLGEYQPGEGYTVAYPQEGEMNGNGTPWAAISLPGHTPWRTITVGQTLAPIAETTIPYDVVEQQYEPSENYRPGRYTWSWLIWQDGSINYEDQVKFIDTSAKMGYEYVLVDNWWDTQIGREKIEELSRYAQSKGVHLLLWYNSNGFENDAPQGPRNIMNRAIARKKEMAWMKKIGVKGIKVDFFAGDKQQTMQLYEDILSDANDYGLQVIFHGCTLPRGWERMYPNYVGSEAALASENVFFTKEHAQREGYDMTMHPFGRNAVGSFDWGGVIMNRMMSKDNKGRHQRYTSDVFEMATAITNQCSVNCVEVTPNVVDGLPQFEQDFLKQIPTTWDETRFIAGYPTKYVVLARRTGDKWLVGGLNGTNQPMTLTLSLPMMAGKTVKYYVDKKAKKGQLWPDSELRQLKIGKDGKVKVTLQPMGGMILE
ncbi:MAG: glycoside hydrolase family 97 catalytic domain-containing protein [Prevotella sp.]|nr:glycoside hydrolase family 97 catalytic domain-containing protein [Prevotella sp.]